MPSDNDARAMLRSLSPEMLAGCTSPDPRIESLIIEERTRRVKEGHTQSQVGVPAMPFMQVLKLGISMGLAVSSSVVELSPESDPRLVLARMLGGLAESDGLLDHLAECCATDITNSEAPTPERYREIMRHVMAAAVPAMEAASSEFRGKGKVEG